ncbi:MAG: cation transporter [Calditrichaeota bacterium]|nr:cation transporter [Calditrichota bacterium]
MDDIIQQHAVYSDSDRRALKLAMSLSLLIGFLMLAIKMGAYILTGSAAILSDAAESVVHVAAVAFAFYSLWLSFKPADATHLYGHEKIGFFSAGVEGALIIIAAFYIIYVAAEKWITGLYLENLGTGTILTAAAMVINALLGGYLVWLGKKKHSLILEANGKHVLTDSWTSLGVLVGLGLTLLTGWLPWDPICAILVALNILYSGFGLIHKSIAGLMDKADPLVQESLESILSEESERYGIRYHELKHRSLGSTYWVEVHLLFPGDLPIREAHRIATEIENRIEGSLKPSAVVSTHLESIEDHSEVHENNRHNL